MRSARSETDEWLMAQVARGHRERLEPLVRRYAGPLTSFIIRQVRDRHLAEELFQEVFLAVWAKRRQYQSPRPFKPWLYTIALNKCRAVFRKTRPPLAIALEPDAPAEPADSGASPAETAIATETAALVSKAVQDLPPQQRAVVVLRVFDGLEYSEIAGIVGRTEATVRSHMHHGLAAIRKALGSHLD